MKRVSCRILAACVVLASASAAWSAESFVAQKHPQADDKNPGTETLPLSTIPAAVAQARPGEWARFLHDNQWLSHGSGENGGLTYGCRWYCDAEAIFPQDLEEKTPCRKGHLQEWNIKMAYTDGNFWLVTEGVEPDKMLPQRIGFWTPLLGAAPGARVTVAL